MRKAIPTEVYLQSVTPLRYRGISFARLETKEVLSASTVTITVACNRGGVLDKPRALKRAELIAKAIPNQESEEDEWAIVGVLGNEGEACSRLSRINTFHWLQEPWRIMGIEEGHTTGEGGWVLVEYVSGRSNKPIFVPCKKELEALKDNIETAKRKYGYKEYAGVLDGRRFTMWDASRDLDDWYHSDSMPQWASRAELRLRVASLIEGKHLHGVSDMQLALIRAKHKLFGGKLDDIEHLVHTCFRFTYDVVPNK